MKKYLSLITITLFIISLQFYSHQHYQCQSKSIPPPFEDGYALPQNYILTPGIELISGNVFGFASGNSSDPVFFIDYETDSGNITIDFGGLFHMSLHATITFRRINSSRTGIFREKIILNNTIYHEQNGSFGEEDPLEITLTEYISPRDNPNFIGSNVTIEIVKHDNSNEPGINCTITVEACEQYIPYYVGGYMLGSGWIQHKNTSLVIYPRNDVKCQIKIDDLKNTMRVFYINITSTSSGLKLVDHYIYDITIPENGSGFFELVLFPSYYLYIYSRDVYNPSLPIIANISAWGFREYNCELDVANVFTKYPLSINVILPTRDEYLVIIKNEMDNEISRCVIHDNYSWVLTLPNGRYNVELYLIPPADTSPILLLSRTFTVSVPIDTQSGEYSYAIPEIVVHTLYLIYIIVGIVGIVIIAQKHK